MGTIINEVGSTAGGVAKVEYKDQSGNVLWYYDDAGDFVINGNMKANSFSVSSLNAVPASPTAIGTAGEIRVTAEGIYIAKATNSWVGGNGNYIRTSIASSGAIAGIFSNLVPTIPQFGKLIAYDTTDTTKFCVYNLYKANSTSIIQSSLVMNNVLAISAVNAAGTIVLNDTSSNIKMSVTREIIS